MDIKQQTINAYKIEEQRQYDEEPNKSVSDDEELIKIFYSNFMANYSNSDLSNMDTVSINSSPCSESNYSFSNNSTTDRLTSTSNRSSNRLQYKSDSYDEDYNDNTKICSKWAKYLLKLFFCIDDE